ncbi:MAG: hypothetical protein U1F77_08010 [Kiritimatiellia bacterium]
MQTLSPTDTEHLPAEGPTPSDTAMHGDAESCVPASSANCRNAKPRAIRLKFQQRLSYREDRPRHERQRRLLIHTGLKALRTR